MNRNDQYQKTFNAHAKRDDELGACLREIAREDRAARRAARQTRRKSSRYDVHAAFPGTNAEDVDSFCEHLMAAA